MIPIFILYNGRRILHYFNSGLSIKSLKDVLAEGFNLQRNSVKLIFGGKILEDMNNISNYNLTKECVINLFGQPSEEKREYKSTIKKNSSEPNYYLFGRVEHFYKNKFENNKKIFTTNMKYDNNSIKKGKYYVFKFNNEIDIINIDIFFTKNNGTSRRFQRKRIRFSKKFEIKLKKGTEYQIEEIDYMNSIFKVSYLKVPIFFENQKNIISNIISSKKAKVDTNVIDRLFFINYNGNPNSELLENIHLNIDKNKNNVYFMNEVKRIFGEQINKTKLVQIDKNQKILDSKKLDINEGEFVFSFNEHSIFLKSHSKIELYKLIIRLVQHEIPFSPLKKVNIKSLKAKKCRKCKGKYTAMYCLSKKYYCLDCYFDTVEKTPEQFLLENDNFINCPNCDHIYEYIGRGSGRHVPDETIIGKKFSNNKSSEELISYLENRIRCTNCNFEFCKSCKKSSFHTGFTCKSFERYQVAEKCKFCLDFKDKCKEKDCKKYWKITGKKLLKCGHENSGTIDFPLCLTCEDAFDDDCYICMDKKLHHKPSIKLDCGDIYHLECLENKLKNKSSTEHINMNFTYCLVCYTRITHPLFEKLNKEFSELNRFMEKEVKDYMKVNGEEGKITEFIKKTRFYNCDDCKKVYFDGPADCADDLVQQENAEVKRKCKKCGVYGKNICPTHGDKFILIKCCFCCDVSVWKCSLSEGTTYFCEPCHRHLTGEKKKCLGKDKCPLGGDHPPANGAQTVFAIGCSRCLDDKLKQNLKWKFQNRGRY